MTKCKKVLMTAGLFVTMVFTSAAPAFASYGGIAVNGKIWPPVVTGWHMVTGGGNSSINWTFSDPNFHPVSGGVPDLSSQYPNWNQPNNMDIVLWAQNHHIQTPLNSIFGWTPVLPTDVQPANYTGPIPCQYTPEILSIIESSGHSPSAFFNAGKAPLTSSSPAPTPQKTVTSTPVPTPVPTPKVSIPAPPVPVVAVPQVPVAPQVAQTIAQKHADPEKDPSSMVAATVTKLDTAKQVADTKAKNQKMYILFGFLGSLSVVAAGVVIWLRRRAK